MAKKQRNSFFILIFVNRQEKVLTMGFFTIKKIIFG